LNVTRKTEGEGEEVPAVKVEKAETSQKPAAAKQRKKLLLPPRKWISRFMD